MSAAQEAVLYAALNMNGRVVYSHESRENVEMNAGFIKTPTRVVGLAPIAPPVAAGSMDTCAEMRALCSACGGTGDVHRADGEWLGECTCVHAWQLRAEKAEADLRQVNEWREAALASNQHLQELMVAKLAAAEARMKELEALRDAAGKLIKAKGRHHTEQNYLALVGAYDATTKGDAAGSAP